MKSRVRWKFKSCPRCMGDIFIEGDIDGWYEQCLQCGWQREFESLAELEKNLPLLEEHELNDRTRMGSVDRDSAKCGSS